MKHSTSKHPVCLTSTWLLMLTLFPLVAPCAFAQLVPSVTIQKMSDAVEGSSDGLYRIALNHPVPAVENIVITFSVLSAPPGQSAATPIADFMVGNLSGGNIVINAGTSETVINVETVNDGIIEGPEVVGIQIESAISPSHTYPISPTSNSAYLLIADANAASSTPVQVLSGGNITEPSANSFIIIKLAGVATSAWPVNVGYALSGTASPGVDFESFGQITIPANTNNIQVPVNIIDDHIIEGTESVTLTLVAGSATDGGGNAFIFVPDPANQTVTVDLTDDDNVPANRILAITKLTDGAEPATSGSFRISLPGDYLAATEIALSFTPTGTGTPSDDYMVISQSLPAYQSAIEIPVIINDDLTMEGLETVMLTMGSSLDAAGNTYEPDPENASATVNITDDESGLPLRLLSFTGYAEQGNVSLDWKTAEEENTDYFAVLRSTDGKKFEQIGEVKAFGAGDNRYSFEDQQPGQSTYYRLKMVDKDGQFTHSRIINLKISDNKQRLAVYPNPARAHFTLQVGDNRLLPTTARLIDAAGKVLREISITGTSQMVPLEQYPGGTYFVTLEGGESIRLVVQH